MLRMRGKRWNFLSAHFVLLFFIFYAVTGLLLFDDYGSGPDEGIERQTSLVNYRYAIEKLNLPISDAVETWLAYLPPLKEYRDRYYGTALHGPLVLIESAFQFRLEPRIFYGMRHFFTFFNFYLAAVCFYQLLKNRFGNRLLALAGVILLVSSPRIFAESFYNNKDILFLSWYIFSVFFLLRWFDKPTIINAAFAGVILAFAINTRMTGIVLLPFLLFFALTQAVIARNWDKHRAGSLVVLLLSATGIFYLITPNFWEHPLQALIETLNFSSSHPDHSAAGNLFMGGIVNASVEWSYIPIWIAVTTPTVILLFSLVGTIVLTIRFVKAPLPFLRNQLQFNDLFVFSTGVFPVIYIILSHVTIYNGWRHCYFCYPTLVYLAVLGIHALSVNNGAEAFPRSVNRIFIPALVGMTMAANILFIIRNHPCQFAYFAPLVRNKAALFSGDYWGISTRQLLEHIVENDDRNLIRIDHSQTNSGSINRGNLAERDRNRLELLYESENADYLLFTRDDKNFQAEMFPDFDTVFTIEVEGDPISRVLKRKGNTP